jgi:O-antigen/teichoic acid export membrane protein
VKVSGFSATNLLRRENLRHLQYAPLLAIAMAGLMVRLLLLARILSVPEFGRASGGFLVASTFCMLGCLGLVSLLQREWPVNMVRGQERRGLVLSAQCIVVAVVSAVAGFVATLLGIGTSTIAPSVFALGLLHGVTQQVFLVVSVESRSRGDSMRYSWQNAARALLVLMFGIGVAWLTESAAAVLAAEAVATGIVAADIFRKALRFGRISAALIIRIACRRLTSVNWIAALTLTATSTMIFLTANADRWVASDLLDSRGFAAYSFAWIVIMVAQASQAILNASIYPHLARTFATAGRPGAFQIGARASTIVLGISLLCALPAGVVIDWSVRRWMPHYEPALALVPWFLAVAALRVSDFWSGFLLVIGHERWLLVLNLLVAAVGVGLWIGWIHPESSSPGPDDVALLAVLLAVMGYVASGAVAWFARGAGERA